MANRANRPRGGIASIRVGGLPGEDAMNEWGRKYLPSWLGGSGGTQNEPVPLVIPPNPVTPSQAVVAPTLVNSSYYTPSAVPDWRSQRPVYNLNPDPVAAATGQPQPQTPAPAPEGGGYMPGEKWLNDVGEKSPYWHAFADPWISAGKDIYKGVLTPLGHMITDPEADPVPATTTGRPIDPGATGVPTGPSPPVKRPYQHRKEGPDAAPYPEPVPGAAGTPLEGYPDVPPPEPPAPEAPEAPQVTVPGIDTGALSLDDYMTKMKQAFPDRNWDNNPKQALADANAKRDLERTSLLAQLSFASGIVSGAGKSWEGLGQGMANAAGTYDKGFEKYQNALQDSADRYQRKQETEMAYDTARRQAALGLYTSAQTQSAENARLVQKEIWDRQGDVLKLNVETEREGAKLDRNTVNAYYAKIMDTLKPDADDTDEQAAAKVAQTERVKKEWQLAIQKGEVTTYVPGMSDSAAAAPHG